MTSIIIASTVQIGKFAEKDKGELDKILD